MTLTYGSLFSGIGGFDLGFDRAGMRCLWQVEIDAAARSVLTRHWPDVPKFADVREVGAHNLAPVDVITFGSPCQDLSVAGKRAGMIGERSGLFYEAIRIIRELRPALAVWENVPGALSSNQGRDFGGAIDALADAGALDICWRVLDAQWFGVAQRRRRVFTVADFRGQRAGQILFEPEGVSGHPETRRATGQDIAGTLGGSSQSGGFRTTDLDNNGAFVPMIAPCLTQNYGKQPDNSDTNAGPMLVPVSVALRGRDGGATAELGGDIATALRASQGGGDKPHVLAVATFDERNVTSKANRSRVEFGTPANTLHAEALSVITPMAVRRLTPTECERLQGFPDGWTEGQANSSRYRQLGNAVAVPCSEWIAKRIVEVMNVS